MAGTRVTVRLAVAAVLVLPALPATAGAAVTTTSVDVPASGARVVRADGAEADPIAVSGRAPGAQDGDEVDLGCLLREHDVTLLAQDVVVYGEAFSTQVPTASFVPGTCRLLAFPADFDTATGDLANFAGPLVTTEVRTTSSTPPGDASGDVLYDFLLAHQQRRGFGAFQGIGSCGLCAGRLFFEDTALSSETVFAGNGWLDPAGGPPGNPSSVRVDGHTAFPSAVAAVDFDPGPPYVPGSNVAGVPLLSYGPTGGAAGAEVAYEEGTDLVRCEAGDPHPYTVDGCDRFVATRVRVERQARHVAPGARFLLSTTFSSLDEQEHAVELSWAERFAGAPGHDTGFRFPWHGEGYATHAGGDTVPGTSEPVTIFTRTDNAKEDGDRRYAQGLVMYDTPIGTITFADPRRFAAPMSFTIPAGGSVVVRQAYAMGTSRGELAAAAADVIDGWHPPSIEITSPPDGSRTTEREIEVRGTASDDRGVVSVTVNGQPAELAADGTWSARVLLDLGDNVLRAAARDAADNETSAVRTVLLEGPHSCCAPPRDRLAPVLSGVGLTARRFRAAGLAAASPVGTRVRYTLSEAATVRFTIVRALPGRRSGGRCRRPTRALRRKPRCTRLRHLGVLRRASPAGASRVRFTGRLRGRALRPRAYRMLVRATDAAGNRSRSRTLRFRIVRR